MNVLPLCTAQHCLFEEEIASSPCKGSGALHGAWARRRSGLACRKLEWTTIGDLVEDVGSR